MWITRAREITESINTMGFNGSRKVTESINTMALNRTRELTKLIEHNGGQQ